MESASLTEAEQVRRASAWRFYTVVWSFYLAVRLGFLLGADVIDDHPDSASYLHGPSFLGTEWRPWTYPLLTSLLDARALVVLQTALSATAFAVLAFAVASQMRHRCTEVAAMLGVLALGASERTTMWDSIILTESLAISLTALLVAAFVHSRATPPWAWLALLTLWIFLRDAHIYLGLLLAAGVFVVARRNRSKLLALGTATILVWSGAASQNNSESERYAVTVNLAYHAASDLEMIKWFLARGMPFSDGFLEDGFIARNEVLQEDQHFQHWVEDSGPKLYLQYLASHPGFTLSGVERLIIDGGLNGEAFVDKPYWTEPGAEGRWWWRIDGRLPTGLPFVLPDDGSAVSLVSVALAGVLTLLALRRTGALDARWILPSVLFASTIPHVLLAYHGTPWEVGRHGALLTFVLVISCWWVALLSVDRLLAARVDPALTEANHSPT